MKRNSLLISVLIFLVIMSTTLILIDQHQIDDNSRNSLMISDSYRLTTQNETIEIQFETHADSVTKLYIREGDNVETIINNTPAQQRIEVLKLPIGEKKDIKLWIEPVLTDKLIQGEWVIKNWLSIQQPKPLILLNETIIRGFTTMTYQVRTNIELIDGSRYGSSPIILLRTMNGTYFYESTIQDLKQNSNYSHDITLLDKHQRKFKYIQQSETLHITDDLEANPFTIDIINLSGSEIDRRITGNMELTFPGVINLTFFAPDQQSWYVGLLSGHTWYEFEFLNMPINFRYNLLIEARSLDGLLYQDTIEFWFNASAIRLEDFKISENVSMLTFDLEINKLVNVTVELREFNSSDIFSINSETKSLIHEIKATNLKINTTYLVRFIITDLTGQQMITEWGSFSTTTLITKVNYYL